MAPYRILMVDDYADDLALERATIERSATRLGVFITVGLATTLGEALESIRLHPPDLVITDLQLVSGGRNDEGFRVRDECAASTPPVQCIVISGTRPFSPDQAKYIVEKSKMRELFDTVLSALTPAP